VITDQIADERRSRPRPQRRQAGFAEARARAMEVERRARTLIGQRPIVAVLAAVAVGYLTARLVSRARR